MKSRLAGYATAGEGGERDSYDRGKEFRFSEVGLEYRDRYYGFKRHCQTNLNRRAKGAGPRRSGRQLPPFRQGGGLVLSEDVATIEVTVLIEMIMDRGVDGGKLLQSLYVPELRHRTLSSSERLM